MKKIYKLVLFSLLINCSLSAFSATHFVELNDNPFSFNPSSMTIDVGDTVIFSLLSGSHTTTSTSVPAGAASWNIPINNTNPTFTYIVNVAGQYNYQCNPHAGMGMIGSFIAVNTSNINTPAIAATFNFSLIRPATYMINYTLPKSSDLKISIYDLTGKSARVLTSSFHSSGVYSEIYSVDELQTGIYLVEFLAGNERIIRRVVID